MQIKFLTTLLLVGVCLTQMTFAHPHETEVQRNIVDDLIAQALKAIRKIQATIIELVDQALRTLDKSKDQVLQTIQDGIEGTAAKLNDIVASGKEQIDEIKHKAEEAGQDISACLADNDNSFNELLNKFIQSASNCISKEADEAIRIVGEAIQVAGEARNYLVDLPEKLQACGTGLSSITCISQLIVEVAQLQVDLPRQIAEYVAEVSTFVAGFKVRVETCSVTAVANAGLAAAGVVADVAACVAAQNKKTIF